MLGNQAYVSIMNSQLRRECIKFVNERQLHVNAATSISATSFTTGAWAAALDSRTLRLLIQTYS